MCFNVFYHVQCVAESTTKDIPSRNIGFITNSRFRCSANCTILDVFSIFLSETITYRVSFSLLQQRIL